MTELWHGMPSRISDLDRLPVERLMVLLAGTAAVVLGALAYLLEAWAGRAGVGDALLLAIALLFGLLLLYAFLVMARAAVEGVTLAAAFGLVLLLVAGTPGVASGILALAAAAVSVARQLRVAA